MSEDVRDRPRFSEEDAAGLAREHYGLTATARSLPSERDQNFRLECASGDQSVLKIANASTDRDILDLQGRAMEHIARRAPGACPRVCPAVAGDEIVAVTDPAGRRTLMRLVTYLPGAPLATIAPHTPELLRDVGRFLGSISRALESFSHPAAKRELNWDLENAHTVVRRHRDRIDDPNRLRLVDAFLSRHEASALGALPGLRQSVIHNDGNDYNVLVDEVGSGVSAARPTARGFGLIDFGDMVHSRTVYEISVCLAYVMLGKPDPLSAAAHVVRGYHEIFPLTGSEVALLFDLTCMRLSTSVSMSAHQRRLEPDNEYLSISEKPAWEVLARLADVHPELAHFTFRHACGLSPGPGSEAGSEFLRSSAESASGALGKKNGLDKDEILRRRREHLGPSLSVSYEQPLTIVRGKGQHLYDESGRAYLDAVNNVCHVGHCHPRVVEAAREQMALLNTNTRYLHENIVRYAERLCALFPDPLSVCFLVCTGSEANDLALRLARNYTGHTDVITVDGAYHGNLTSLIDISPYKFDGPGGTGAPPHVHKVAAPDGYRGIHKSSDPLAGTRYAAYVRDAARAAHERGRSIAAFICESLLGCGGQIVLPPGYLKEAYAHVRDAGGICLADEVQVGFGRVGSHFWGFETQDVVPDIVTLGKPIGNGHPMAAVVTTRAIAEAFANGMEYFNTYGGNPVSCAVGLAVLDVIEDEGLREKALKTGDRLKAGCEQLKAKHAVVGDVRGLGLFVGIELVLDRDSLEPAAEVASYVVNRMRESGVLLSTDGPLHNVLKIKPPLVFTEDDADRLVRTLDQVLAEDAARVR